MSALWGLGLSGIRIMPSCVGKPRAEEKISGKMRNIGRVRAGAHPMPGFCRSPQCRFPVLVGNTNLCILLEEESAYCLITECTRKVKRRPPITVFDVQVDASLQIKWPHDTRRRRRRRKWRMMRSRKTPYRLTRSLRYSSKGERWWVSSQRPGAELQHSCPTGLQNGSQILHRWRNQLD
jgi:hypothetical protein